jgi:signal transduction histidine kinase/FixJ family two-component response regulator
VASELEKPEPVRVLFVEDSPDDVELARMELEDAGLEIDSAVVSTADDLRTQLQSRTWDIVISDYWMPSFTGLDALHIVQEYELDMPFILVSGTVGEDVAVELMRAGAHDYLLKDRLARLPTAVERELRALRRRKEQRRAEHAQRLVVQASAILASSLEIEQTLGELARLIAGDGSDVCIFNLSEVDFGPEWVSAAADLPESQELAFALGLALSKSDASATNADSGVTSSRSVELVPIVDAERIASLSPEPAVADLIQRIGTRSFVRTPLESGGRTLGFITLLSTRQNRRYDAFDLALARDLAWRVASAVDNARLYRNAQDAIRMRDEFLSIASHELRTPITAIRLQVRGVRRVAANPPGPAGTPGNPVNPANAALNERLSRVERSMARLSQLVDSLLDVSRIATGKLKLHPEPTDLGKLARQVMEYVEPDAERAGVEITLVELSPAEGAWDLLRLEQVLMNLISNALKFGAGRPIEIETGTYPATNDGSEKRRAFVRVIDHGLGVAPEDAERIFGKFERSVPARQYGGLGLGLYISRQIVEAHDGTISARPTEGGGATFEVTLPLA